MNSRRRIVCSLAAAFAALLNAAIASAAVRVSQHNEQWTLENQRLRVTVDTAAGTLSVDDKTAGYQWKQTPPAKSKAQPRFRDARKVDGETSGIVFAADFGTTQGKPNRLTVTLSLRGDDADLFIAADMQDRATVINPFSFLEPLVLDSPAGVLAVADYSNGHLYPLDLKPFPRGGFSASRLDMPWVGVCDLERGFGYLLLVETADNAQIFFRKTMLGTREVVAPQVQWTPSKKTFAYPRRLMYHFAAQGGYVALAKRYRQYAQEHGLLVTFAEKLKKNPNIERLFGAPDVWGNAGLAFAKAAKAAGVEKMLIHGSAKPAEMKAVNELGYLTSEYDNYTDVMPLAPGKTVDSSHDRIPENVVLAADGSRMKAWLTFDKKQQFMKRCPALWLEAAKAVIPKVLATRPFLGRFIDVTTAEGLYECYDANHPLTHAEKRACGPALLGYVRSLGLVTGGEHGIWWAVPYLDYIEGMMSGGYASWPAGHLIRPKTKDQQFDGPGSKYASKWETYARFGIGHEYRAPLWELVFHDCIVSTWYWGDASDFLLTAAPEVTPRKDAFNVLYGTIPLLWAGKEGSWTTDREAFLRTYRNTCKFHEVIAGKELLSHEFVTRDRAVQRTRFADGTEVVVNFGEAPYEAQVGGKGYLLPQNGFAVHGPQIDESLALVDGKPVTTIRTAKFQYSDAK
jgi:hypothetical protein